MGRKIRLFKIHRETEGFASLKCDRKRQRRDERRHGRTSGSSLRTNQRQRRRRSDTVVWKFSLSNSINGENYKTPDNETNDSGVSVRVCVLQMVCGRGVVSESSAKQAASSRNILNNNNVSFAWILTCFTASVFFIVVVASSEFSRHRCHLSPNWLKIVAWAFGRKMSSFVGVVKYFGSVVQGQRQKALSNRSQLKCSMHGGMRATRIREWFKWVFEFWFILRSKLDRRIWKLSCRREFSESEHCNI